jgi:hypothetical protein
VPSVTRLKPLRSEIENIKKKVGHAHLLLLFESF